MPSPWSLWILRGMTRPNPLLWIWYTLGGRLGSAYREWVLHDTTCRTRWLRQVVRVVVQVVLPAAVVLAVLGVSWIVWAAVGLGLLLALWYSLAYINSTAERRLVMRALRERDHREHADQIVRYMQTYRKAGG
jgi:Family of unknown function (DUF5313)